MRYTCENSGHVYFVLTLFFGEKRDIVGKKKLGRCTYTIEMTATFFKTMSGRQAAATAAGAAAATAKGIKPLAVVSLDRS